METAWRISIASPPDREHLVAEIFFGYAQWAEINQEGNVPEIEFYPRPDGKPWRLSLEDALAAIKEARTRLGV